MNYIKLFMKVMMIAIALIFIFEFNVFAALTEKQCEDVANFTEKFITEGNSRRDTNGYPLLVYALSNNWNTCVDIRNKGYKSELYYIKNNGYHYRNGKYIELGNKWCMDCGGFIAYIYNTTLGLDMYLGNEPWHIKDMYADANSSNSKYLEFVYKNTAIANIDFSILQKGDIVVTIGARENHGLIYTGNYMSAHASRNAIKYSKDPIILGFDIVQLNKFYLSTTKVSVLRVKDNIVNRDQIINSTIIWPDNGEVQNLLPYNEPKKEAISVLDNEEIVKNKNSITGFFKNIYNMLMRIQS